MTGKIDFTHGYCPECDRPYTLIGDGTVRAHPKFGQSDRSRQCVGSRHLPNGIADWRVTAVGEL